MDQQTPVEGTPTAKDRLGNVGGAFPLERPGGFAVDQLRNDAMAQPARDLALDRDEPDMPVLEPISLEGGAAGGVVDHYDELRITAAGPDRCPEHIAGGWLGHR